MKQLDRNAIIPTEKLIDYLLIPLKKDDKSQFLARAGYTLDNWQQLADDIRNQLLPLPALPTVLTPYGQKYIIIGELTGPNQVVLTVRTIWIINDDETRFVTLFPA
jgi:hypothetical protein